MQYPKMVYLKAQDVSEGNLVFKLVSSQEEENQELANGYVLTVDECSVEEVRKRGRPPKAVDPEPIPEQTEPQTQGLF